MSSQQRHLVVQDELTEGGDMFSPLHQDQELLLHGLPDIRDAGQSLGVDLVLRQLCADIVTLRALNNSVLVTLVESPD